MALLMGHRVSRLWLSLYGWRTGEGGAHTLGRRKGCTNTITRLSSTTTEAHTNRLMHYESNMEDDIKRGKVVLEWFHLL